MLSWMQFINTALIPFALLLLDDNNFSDEDMLRNLFFIFIGNALSNSFILIFDPLHFIKWY